MKRTALARHTGFKPRPSGLSRTTRLAPVSKKARASRRTQTAAYAGAADREQCWCDMCGKPGPVEHAHLYTQKARADLRNNPLNWLIVGKYCGCHDQQENNKAAFMRRRPDAWAKILRRMHEADPAGFERFAALHSDLIPKDFSLPL